MNWQDHLDAQRGADRAIVFAVAWHAGLEVPKLSGQEIGDTSWYDGNINDATATFAAAHPERLIGFMALHPHESLAAWMSSSAAGPT